MSAPAAAAPEGRWALLRQGDFVRLWLTGLVMFVVRWLELLAVGVFVYEETGSPFLVAMMTLLRLLPMSLFGAFVGAAAERLDRRRCLIAVNAALLVLSLALTGLALAGALAVWHIAVASFLGGVGWTADNPIRRVMIGDVVGSERIGQAMSADVGSNNASRMVGPTLGGLLLVHAGMAGVFALAAALYLVALLATWNVRHRTPAAPEATRSALAQVGEGLAAVAGDRRLVGIFIITVIFNVFGWPFTSMIPVIGKDHLALDPEGVGLLASLDGVGAFCGAVAIAVWAKPAWYPRLYVGGLTLYLVMVIAFAVVPSPGLAGAVLLAAGTGGAAFSIMQATLVYLASPPGMRSRMLGVLSVCIGAGPIGFLALGLLADGLGAQAATLLAGLAGLLVLALSWPYWRRIGEVAAEPAERRG